MKRMLALLFCGAMLFSLAACGGNGESSDTDSVSNSTVSQTDTASEEVSASSETETDTAVSTLTDTESSTDSQTDTSTDTGTVTPPVQQPEEPKEEPMKYGLIMDDSSKRILVVNPEKGGSFPSSWTFKSSCVVWSWSTDDAKGAQMEGRNINIDCTKYRYSAYYQKDVIIFCGSGGYAGIIDYKTKDLLFEAKIDVDGPHSVELLPNGDLVVACSGNSNYDAGCVLYYPLSAGETTYCDKVMLWGAHSVVYDPDNKLILALGGKEVIGLSVTDGGTKNAKMTSLPEKHVEMFYPGTTAPNGSGHELIPVLGQPGKYFLAADNLFLYDSTANTISYDDALATKYNLAQTKGMAYFADGVSVQTADKQGGSSNYRSLAFRVLYPDGDTMKEVMVPHISGRETYKVSVFTKDYR